jgi:ABC-2 type transport system permease protein
VHETMRVSTLLNRRVLAVMENEWAQLIRNRVVVFTTLGPTLLLVALAIGVLALSSFLTVENSPLKGTAETALKQFPGIDSSHFSGADSFRVTLLNPFLVLFQVIPLVVPITIASYSIVGEKQLRTLEPLLATPIKTWELLAAKGLSAAIPGILSTWWGFAMFALVGRFVTSDAIFSGLIVSQTWLLAILLLTPLFTLLAVGLGVLISSKVKDPNSAQQLGSLVILPVIAMLLAQVSGAVQVGVEVVLTIALVVGIIDIALLVLSVRLFRREEILTGWQ